MPTTAGRAAGVVCATVLLVATTSLTGAAVVDDGPPPEPAGGVSAADLRDSVRAYRAEPARAYSLERAVTRLGEGIEREGGAAVISLSTDLLFAPNSWDLPGSAPGRIAVSTPTVDLPTDVPNGATVQVTGHTDSRPTIGQDFDNQELSERRAEAVAAALGAERPDLDLQVSGVGHTDPAVPEDPEDPDTYAANRRVEIRYED
mgnify:CR=1 FL=1